MAKPFFSSAEQVMLWQGQQRLIEQAQQHQADLIKGFQGVELDSNTKALDELYRARISQCKTIQGKLPQLNSFTGHNSDNA